MAYIGKSPTGSGVRTRYYYTATGGETSLSGADDNGKTLTFSDGEYMDVYLNGVLLVHGTDYGTGTANTISSLAALAGGDIAEVIVYDVYNIADVNRKALRTRYYKTAAGGETSISGTDDSGATITFAANAQIEVKLNGVSLVQGTDYNTTSANTVGGLSALTAGQVVEIVKYERFVLGDTVSKADGGTFVGDVGVPNLTASGAVTVTGDLTVDTSTLYVDSTNNLVGIGETSPSSNLHVKGGAGANIAIQSTAGSHWRIGDAVGASNGTLVIRDHTNSANRMTIDSTGRVRINRASGLFTEQLLVESDTTSVNPMTINNSRSTAASDYSIIFGRAGSIVGSIQTSLSATSYVTSSDYRLKTSVNYDWDATTRLKQLRPARFEWIADGDDAVPVDGFLAHEVQDIVPEAISGTKDAVDDDGNPIYQGIDQSKLTPLLTKALIEAVEKIEQLEARITALENA